MAVGPEYLALAEIRPEDLGLIEVNGLTLRPAEVLGSPQLNQLFTFVADQDVEFRVWAKDGGRGMLETSVKLGLGNLLLRVETHLSFPHLSYPPTSEQMGDYLGAVRGTAESAARDYVLATQTGAPISQNN